MRYLENYLERIKRKGNLTLADAISKTVSDVVPQYISNKAYVIINKQVERVSKDAIEALNSKEIIIIFPSQKKITGRSEC